jgi:DNA mismatch repair protein MutL
MEIIQDLAILGYQINPVSSNTFVINGTPDGMKDKDIQKLIEQMLEQFKRNAIDLQLHKKLNLARTMSAQTAVKYGQLLNEQEMTALIDQLFACQVPEVSPDGRKIIVTLPLDQLQQLFK